MSAIGKVDSGESQVNSQNLLGRGKRLGLLGGMGMFFALINFQFGHEHTAEAIFGDHATHGVSDQFLRMTGADLLDRGVFFSTLPARIRHEFLVGFLFAGNRNLLGINNDHEIAGIEVWGIDGFISSAQDIRDLGGKTAQDSAIGINDMPLAFIYIDLRQMRFHLKSQQGRGETTKESRQVNRLLQRFWQIGLCFGPWRTTKSAHLQE